MESPLGEKSEVPARERWRKLFGVVGNPRRRFRFTPNLNKREDAAAMRRTNQEKLRVATLVSSAAYQFLGGKAEKKEEEERLLEGDLTHETTEGFDSEQSHQETSEDFNNLGDEETSEEDDGNNNRDSGAFKAVPLEEKESQNNSEIEELRDNFLSSLPVKEPSLVEESSSRISLSRGRGGEVLVGQNRGGVFQVEHHEARGKPHQVLGLEINTNEQSVPARFSKMRRIALWRKLRSKAFLKWVFVVLNVVVEVCQATLTQEAAQGKMRHQIYLKLSIATSSFCLVMSLVEAFHEGRSSKVVWRRRGYCCWFYYPGSQRRLFGRFSLYFGIICSIFQLIVNLITTLIGNDFVKFDYAPLLLSICYLVARIIASRKKTNFHALVKCKTHGCNAAKAQIVDGSKTWLYECPECQEDIP